MNPELRYYRELALRRLPLLSLLVGGILALALAAALLLPPVYRAEAVLLVESAQIPDDLASPTVRTAAAEQLQIIEQRMLARANMLDTARRFRLYDGQALDPTEIVDDMRRRTRLTVETGANRATLVQLSFDAGDAGVAAEVANAFVSFMLEENTALRTSIAAQTVDFFRREVERLNEELDTRSARILEFQLENPDALPDDLPALRLRQSELQSRRAEIQDQIRRLDAERDEYVARYERTGRIGVVVEDDIAPFLRRLRELQDELDRIRATEGEDSPRARDVQARIASVDRSLDAHLAVEAVEERGRAAVFALHLSRIDEQHDALAEERAVVEERMAEVAGLMQAALRNATTLEAMRSDYESIRLQQAQALSSVSAAETGDLMESLSRGQRITVIEQAVAPPRPASPNRRLIVAGGLVLGLSLAAALLWLAERLNQTVRRPSDLQRRLGIAPFASIPHIATPGTATALRAGRLGLWLALLGGVPAALYAVHVFYLPLDLLWRQTIAALGLGPLLEQLRPGR